LSGFFSRIRPGVDGLLLAAVMLVTWSVGFRLGRRLRTEGARRPGKVRGRGRRDPRLLLAFTFSWRFPSRPPAQILSSRTSNSIGDFTPARASCRTGPNEAADVVRGVHAAPTATSPETLDSARLERELGRFPGSAEPDDGARGRRADAGTPIACPTNTLKSDEPHRRGSSPSKDRLRRGVVGLLFVLCHRDGNCAARKGRRNGLRRGHDELPRPRDACRLRHPRSEQPGERVHRRQPGADAARPRRHGKVTLRPCLGL